MERHSGGSDTHSESDPDCQTVAGSQFRSASFRGASEVSPSLKAPPEAPSSPCFWRLNHYDPSWPHISQDSLHAQTNKRKWRHCVTFAGLGSRNRDVRVKHLVTQPGNAPKAKLSHLTPADQVNEVSEGLAFTDHKDHKDQVLLRQKLWSVQALLCFIGCSTSV